MSAEATNPATPGPATPAPKVSAPLEQAVPAAHRRKSRPRIDLRRGTARTARWYRERGWL